MAKIQYGVKPDIFKYALLCAPTGTTQMPERRNTPEQCTNVATTPSSPQGASLWVLNVPSRAPSVSGMIGPPQTTFLLSRTRTPVEPGLVHIPDTCVLSCSGLGPGRLRPVLHTASWGSVSSHCADHRGVYGKLCAVEQRQTVGDQPLGPGWRSRSWTHPGTCLSADSCSATFQREPTATKNPCVSTSSPVVTTSSGWPHRHVAEHKGAGTRGDAEGGP